MTKIDSSKVEVIRGNSDISPIEKNSSRSIDYKDCSGWSHGMDLRNPTGFYYVRTIPCDYERQGLFPGEFSRDENHSLHNLTIEGSFRHGSPYSTLYRCCLPNNTTSYSCSVSGEIFLGKISLGRIRLLTTTNGIDLSSQLRSEGLCIDSFTKEQKIKSVDRSMLLPVIEQTGKWISLNSGRKIEPESICYPLELEGFGKVGFESLDYFGDYVIANPFFVEEIPKQNFRDFLFNRYHQLGGINPKRRSKIKRKSRKLERVVLNNGAGFPENKEIEDMINELCEWVVRVKPTVSVSEERYFSKPTIVNARHKELSREEVHRLWNMPRLVNQEEVRKDLRNQYGGYL